ncbi:BatD family protein, partial [Bacteroidota bacterium]
MNRFIVNTLFKIRILSFIGIIILFSPHGLSGQEFNATVDKTTVGQNERFQVYFTFEGEDVNGVRNFTPPSFEGFRVLSGPNQSTSMQIINGKVSGSLTYSFIVQGSEIGKYPLGTASVEYEGDTYKTDPLQIEVVKGTPKQSRDESSTGVSDEELAENVFIVATADKRKAVIGEQITITYKLYTRLNISSPQISKLPTYQGFWAEELNASQNIMFNIEMYNGERYRAATIKTVALFPSKTGKLSVTPFELNVPVLVRKKRKRSDIFDQFFNDSFFGKTETVDYIAKSNKVIIDVSDVPKSNVPDSFNGAVGKYNFKAEINKSNVELNEGITLRVTISGQGNIKLLDVPEIKLPPGFEMYDPKTSETINLESFVLPYRS